MDPAQEIELPKPTLVEQLAKELSETATASKVYGAPVERDGVTVIPVAKAAFGFGGGSGHRGPQSGGGGGGGARVTPLGYIEIKNGAARFCPIWDPLTLLPLVATGGLVAGFLLRSLSRLVHRAA